MASEPNRVRIGWSDLVCTRDVRRYLLISGIAVLVDHGGDEGMRASLYGIDVVATGRGHDEFNMAIVRERTDDPNRAIAWACNKLAGRGLAQMIQVPSHLHDHVAAALRACGATPTETVPGMVLQLPSPAPAGQPRLRIERATSYEDLRACAVAMSRGFGAPTPEDSRDFFPASLVDDPRVGFFSGFVDDRPEPVATSVGVLAEGIAGVYAVTVHPDHRRNGLGAAITWAAVEFGRSRGADVAALQASEMGRPVYASMGFQPTELVAPPVVRLLGDLQLPADISHVLALSQQPVRRGQLPHDLPRRVPLPRHHDQRAFPPTSWAGRLSLSADRPNAVGPPADPPAQLLPDMHSVLRGGA